MCTYKRKQPFYTALNSCSGSAEWSWILVYYSSRVECYKRRTRRPMTPLDGIDADAASNHRGEQQPYIRLAVYKLRTFLNIQSDSLHCTIFTKFLGHLYLFRAKQLISLYILLIVDETICRFFAGTFKFKPPQI